MSNEFQKHENKILQSNIFFLVEIKITAQITNLSFPFKGTPNVIKFVGVESSTV